MGTAIVTGLHYYGQQRYQSGFAAAVSDFQSKQSDYIDAARTIAAAKGVTAQKTEQKINTQLSEALNNEIQSPVDHSCINDSWLQQYNHIADQSSKINPYTAD